MNKVLLVVGLLYANIASADLLNKGVEASDRGDLKSAMKFWTQGCEKGDMHSCDKLGMMHYFGYGTQKDQLKALSLYDKACNAGIVEDCYKIAKMYDYGYTVEVNKSKALQMYQKACEHNIEDSCKRSEEILRGK
jgi:hypothetical protein